MRGEHLTTENRKEPIPDIERLFTETLQFSQGTQYRVSMFAKWVSSRHPNWQRQYSTDELYQRTKDSITALVQGPMHLDVSDDFPTATTIQDTLWDDAQNFLAGFKEREKPFQVTLEQLLDAIITGDFYALTSEKNRSKDGSSIDLLREVVNLDPAVNMFTGRPRRRVPRGIPPTPQRDKYNSMFVYYVLMTSKERARVHGQNYGLHPALEEMCTEVRGYYHELRRKQNPSAEEKVLLEAAELLINMWNKHHPHAQVSLT